jgi:hypothetical protein
LSAIDAAGLTIGIAACVNDYRNRLAARRPRFKEWKEWRLKVVTTIENLEALIGDSRFWEETCRNRDWCEWSLYDLKRGFLAVKREKQVGHPKDSLRLEIEATIAYRMDQRGIRVTQSPDGVLARILVLFHEEVGIPEGDLSHSLKEACRGLTIRRDKHLSKSDD